MVPLDNDGAMLNQRVSLEDEDKLRETILQEKARGTPDLEIGRKYGVTFRYIERIITESQGINVSAFRSHKKIETLYPKDFKEEQTTVWSFRQRGKWATHSGEYRGNWSPYIPRNVILKYSKLGELVLDYFCGAGTTAVEAKLLGRRCTSFDINDKAVELAKRNIDFNIETQQLTFDDRGKYHQIYEPELSIGDARDLSILHDNSVDLICAHPPYANIIHYTDSREGDLSFFDIADFLDEMSKVARESFRVLKPGRQCAILIGDTRRKKRVIPLGFKLIDVYLNAGFKLRELVIKRQYNCKSTGFWYTNSIKYNFLLLAHEYLPVFEKPKSPSFLGVSERMMYYGLAIPILEKLPKKRKLDRFETTTVWILPKKDFEKQLNKNVIDRYSSGRGYSAITFVSHSNDNEGTVLRMGWKRKGLLLIKSSVPTDDSSWSSNIELCLQKTKEIVSRELPEIDDDGSIVIQTQDLRIDGYIEPMAKRVVDMLSLDNLRLKEVIIVVPEGLDSKTQISDDYLEIVHQYLLVYEVAR